MASMPALYDALWNSGREFGIANYGLYAVNGMRMEKGYKAWGAELTNELNMLEADMPRFINLNKSDFVGKSATVNHTVRPLKIVYAEVDAGDADARGGEPVHIHVDEAGDLTAPSSPHRRRPCDRGETRSAAGLPPRRSRSAARSTPEKPAPIAAI